MNIRSLAAKAVLRFMIHVPSHELLPYRVFWVTTVLGVLAPLIGEGSLWVASGHPGEAILGGVFSSAICALNYVWFLKTKKLKRSALINATVSVIGVSIATVKMGGFSSPPFIFHMFFVVSNGFLLGARGAAATSIYNIGFFAFLALASQKGWIIPPSPASTGVWEIAFLNSLCSLFIGTVICLYELERKRSETQLTKMNESLRIEKKRFETLVVGLDQSALLSQVDEKGHFFFVNDKFCETSGFTRAELLGADFKSTMTGLNTPEQYRQIWDLISQGHEWNGELAYRKKYGETGWLETTVIPVANREEGQKPEYLFIQKEVTEEKAHQIKDRQTKNFYEDILNSMKEGFVIQDKSGKILHFNEAALDILGLTRDELMGRTSRDPRWRATTEAGEPLPPEDHPAMITLRTGQPQSNFLIGVDVVGGSRSRWLLANSVPLDSEYEGIKTGVLVTFADVTDQIEKQKKLFANEAQLREAQSVAQIGSWHFDLQTQQIRCTEEMFNIFPPELSQGELTFDKLACTVHPDDQSRWMKAVALCKSDGTPYVLKRRLVSGDKITWVEGRGKAIKDRNGKVIALYGTCQDITERMQLEQENEFIIDALNIGIWKFDPVSNALSWDKSMYSLYGIDAKDFRGAYEAWENSLTEESKTEAVKDLQAALRGEKEFNTTFEIKTKDGGTRHIGGKGVVIRNEKHEPIKMFGLNWDRSEEVRLEQSLTIVRAKSQQNAKLVSLGEMSAGIAHEINNPLAIISGSIAVLEKYAGDPEKFKAKTEIIGRAVDRIAKIVNGLRKFSRTTDVKNYGNHDLNRLIEESLVLTDTKAKRHATQIIYELGESAIIHCDEVEIEQVIINLINNGIDAVKGNPDKWVKIEVMEKNTAVVLRVTDSGRGIPDHIVHRLFDPFFTTKMVGEGTGLGLSIVKGILDEHKATIDVLRGEPHTCFEIRFEKVVKAHAA